MIGTLMAPRDVEVRGWLALTDLPPDVQAAEDATADADRERALTGIGVIRCGFGVFKRGATDTERLLLADLGHDVPDVLWTYVDHKQVIRRRTWPQIEEQELKEQENTHG